MVNVYIPTPFRSFVGNRSSVEVEGNDVAEVLANLDARFPGFRNLCYNAEGAIPLAHQHLREQPGDQLLERQSQRHVTDGDQVAVIPALAGGAPERRRAV